MSDNSPMDILASLAADTTDVPDETVVAEPTTTDTDESVDTGEQSSDAAVESVDDNVDVGGDETPVEPTLYAGKYKTPEELENAYKHAEQRMHEEAQQRAQYEAYIQQMQEQYEAEQERIAAEQNAYDPFSTQPTNVQELIEYTYEDPEEAFWFAAQNAPAQVARVISEIRNFDNAGADRLLVEYNQWQAQTYQEQMAAQQAEVQRQMMETQAQAQLPYLQQQVTNAVAKAHQNIASLPNYNDVKAEMAQLIRERPNLINVESESTLAVGLRDVYDLAVARNSAKIQAANTAREAAAGNAAVESGGFNETEEVEQEDPAEAMKNSIFGSINGFSF